MLADIISPVELADIALKVHDICKHEKSFSFPHFNVHVEVEELWPRWVKWTV